MKRKILIGFVIAIAFAVGYSSRMISDAEYGDEAKRYYDLASAVYDDNRNMQKTILELCDLLKPGKACHPEVIKVLGEYPDDVHEYPLPTALSEAVEEYKQSTN